MRSAFFEGMRETPVAFRRPKTILTPNLRNRFVFRFINLPMLGWPSLERRTAEDCLDSESSWVQIPGQHRTHTTPSGRLARLRAVPSPARSHQKKGGGKTFTEPKSRVRDGGRGAVSVLDTTSLVCKDGV